MTGFYTDEIHHLDCFDLSDMEILIDPDEGTLCEAYTNALPEHYRVYGFGVDKGGALWSSLLYFEDEAKTEYQEEGDYSAYKHVGAGKFVFVYAVNAQENIKKLSDNHPEYGVKWNPDIEDVLRAAYGVVFTDDEDAEEETDENDAMFAAPPVTYREVAADRSILPFNPANKRADGSILIGCLIAEDNSVQEWSVVCPDVAKGYGAKGYALQVAIVSDELDENFEFVLKDEPDVAYVLPPAGCGVVPVGDEVAHAIGDTSLDTPDLYPDIESAYDTFLTFVYATERTEAYLEVADAAHDIIKGYIDAWSCSFDDFKEKFASASVWDGYAMTFSHSSLANAMLCVRYPFLIPWWRWIDEKDDEWYERDGEKDPFGRTSFKDIPTGWRRRFGLELCEDLRNLAWDPDPRVWLYRLCETSISQTKEKFGELRTYWSTFGQGSQEIMEAYCAISRSVCINCGRADKTRITGGWISPYCWDEIESNRRVANIDQYRKRSADMRAKFLDGLEDEDKKKDWKLLDGIDAYAQLVHVLNITSPAASADEMERMLTNWEWRSYSGKSGGEAIITRQLVFWTERLLQTVSLFMPAK